MAELVNAPEEGNPEEVTKPEASIPEAYQGKTFEEVMAMHQELQRKMGQQSEELGQLRAFAEQQVANSGSSEESSIDFFDDPERAIERIIERKLAPFNATLQTQQEAAIRERLDASYPNWEETVKSTDFQSWVADSKVRTKLFLQANNLDYDAANELLDTWQTKQGAESKAESKADRAVKRDRRMRAAVTEKGSAGMDPRKILNRSDLRTLKQTNPAKYNELLPEIRQAYAEGRVR